MSKFTDSLKEKGIKIAKKMKPKNMTDEELAQLRFTYVSEEDALKVEDEINRRHHNGND
ncbi:hypothetical protein ACNNMX_01990 [Aerococcus viridans]|uniref:hypothetical protein n=1 Tax=Aerococcus viridans TaxID=1377 RepID=UPI003AA7DFA3